MTENIPPKVPDYQWTTTVTKENYSEKVREFYRQSHLLEVQIADLIQYARENDQDFRLAGLIREQGVIQKSNVSILATLKPESSYLNL